MSVTTCITCMHSFSHLMVLQHVEHDTIHQAHTKFAGGHLAGFRKIGFNPLIALAAVPVIHGSLSYPTQPGFIPDIWFSINTNNIHKCVWAVLQRA